MEIETHDWGRVASVSHAGVNSGFGTGAVVAVAGIDGAFFGADEEGCGIGDGEGHACWAEVFGFAGGWGGEFEVFLGETEHVDGPSADDSVGGAGDDVVGVLSAD